MRAHGTRACYVFGPEPGSDRSKGCRCEPCSEANRAYARYQAKRKRLEGLGREDGPWAAPYIDAAEVRDHLRWLERTGIGLRTVAEQTGCSRSSLAKLKAGTTKRCRRDTAAAVLAVGRSAAADGAYVDAGPTWKLIDELLAVGHTRTALARALGSQAKTPALQLSRTKVTAANARAVAELHERLMFRQLEERRWKRERAAERKRRQRSQEAA